jgi:Mg2+-importing ATPase
MSGFWSEEPEQLLSALGSREGGLTAAEATTRLRQHGPNSIQANRRRGPIAEFLGQFKSSIVLLLLGASILSWALGDRTDSVIILGIVFASAILSFLQEHSAGDAVQKLLALVQTRVTVLRDGSSQSVPLEAVVPGDVVVLSAGSVVPGDGALVEAQNLFVDEAPLTGETFPVEKRPGVCDEDAPLSQRRNTVFSGTHVVSGTGTALVVKTAKETEFGEIAQRLQAAPPETEFERGIRHFGFLLIEFTLILTIGVFGVNVFFHRPVLESLLFALALAVGLTPQLLPAIISVNLARGAQQMAHVKVIVKRLASIENFGSMNVLCSDKTGTLTQGIVRVHAAYGPAGAEDPEVLRLARINAAFESGFTNPIDTALLEGRPDDLTAGLTLLGELPYDFLRKRLTVLVSDAEGPLLVTKGALEPVLEVCTQVHGADHADTPLDAVREMVQSEFAAYSAQGLRVLGVAVRRLETAPSSLAASDETDMAFVGFLVLDDPLRPDIVQTVRELRDLGVSLKMITGDNRLVAASVAKQVGLSGDNVLTGPELRKMSDSALRTQVLNVDVFAEIEPNQKERLIVACKRAGFVVGYTGDGINDGAALHVADVGISVANAVDVAKDAADMVMLEQGLEVLVNGVREGRKTFANTMKYVFMASSANFGNMFSMAGASLILPFLPLLPKQILLMNLLTDLPEMTIAGDTVDREQVEKPRRWDLAFVRRFMLIFGSLSSVFDFMAFGTLRLMGASQDLLRTGWFTESIVSATLIVLVMRTRRPFFQSKPSRALMWATIAVVVAVPLIPLTPLGSPLGLVVMPAPVWLAMFGIAGLYMASAEVVKHWFYNHARWSG